MSDWTDASLARSRAQSLENIRREKLYNAELPEDEWKTEDEIAWLRRLADASEQFAEREQVNAQLRARVEELERRWGMDPGMPCGDCGGPHPFDTSVPSVVWNEVIRSRGLSEYLCTTCIVREFVRARRSFTATLWGNSFHGVAIEVRIGEKNATDAAAIQEENNRLRVEIHDLDSRLEALRAAGIKWRDGGSVVGLLEELKL